MAEDKKKVTIDEDAVAGMDANGDGHISAEEYNMNLEFKRKALRKFRHDLVDALKSQGFILE